MYPLKNIQMKITDYILDTIRLIMHATLSVFNILAEKLENKRPVLAAREKDETRNGAKGIILVHLGV